MRKINIKICTALLAVLFLLTGMLFVFAERGVWTDDGKYDTGWLGDYENASAYTVSDSSHLAAFARAAKLGYTFEGKTVTLTDNVDMSSAFWEPAFSSEKMFKGTFDGQGHIIWGLEVSSDSDVGAFISYNAGTVKNVSVKITSTAKTSAGIAAYNTASIHNCAVSGSLGSLSALCVGGIAGENSGTVDNCLSVASIKRSDADSGVFCGGIAAKNTSTVSNCIYDGADKEIGDGTAASDGAKYTDAQSAVSALNTVASAASYAEWALDNTNIFEGYPIMKNAAPNAVSVGGILFDYRELDMKIGDKAALSVTFYPSDSSNKSLVWLSTNETVVTVDESGNITAHKQGYAIIRAESVDGAKQANCYVSVRSGPTTVKSESVKLDRTEYSLLLGQSAQIIATVLPSTATDKTVIYNVEDEGVVTCDSNGTLTPVASGVTVVMVTSGDGHSVMAAVVTVFEDTYSQTWDGTAETSFAGGDGTKVNPYIIETPGQLAKLANDVNGGNSYEGCYFVQRISIRLNDTTFEDWRSRLSHINNWTPIGVDSEHVFRGNYDGGGFSINGINIDKESGVGGLFGYTEDGVIQNINIKHSYIKAGEFTGSVVGYNKSKIQRCTTEASVVGTNYVGGIAGYSSEIIEFCQNNGTLSGDKFIGGITGYADRYILNCSNTGAVQGKECIGGICGKNAAVIENCFNDAAVIGDGMCGGISGHAVMDVVNCHSFVMADGMNNIGAIAGYSDKVLSSYVPSTLTATGNLKNSEDYVLTLEVDGSYSSKKKNKPYVEVLNLFGGCIYSDTYFEWGMKDYIIAPTNYVKALSSVADTASGIELSGAEIVAGNSYSFEDVLGEKLVAALSKINQSAMFEQTKLESQHVMLAKNITLLGIEGSASTVQSTDYRLTLPFDLTKVKDYETIGEFESFAHVAFINITDSEMLIYIPEFVKKGSDGVYSGNMRCISHSLNGMTVTGQVDMAHKFSFYYSAGFMSFAAKNTGEWLVAELGENENIIPIETDSSEVTAPPITQPEKREFDFSIILTVIVCVVLFIGAAAVILIQRSKNNLRIIEQQPKEDYFKGDTADEDEE